MQNLESTISNIENAIQRVTNKEHRIVFLAPDTRGSARSSVAYVYRQALTLKNNGYNVSILHEKNDYIKPGSWLGDEYDTLDHESIEENKLAVGPQDFIVVPEIYGNVFEQIQQLPIDKILLVQSYEYLLDNFAPGKSWVDFDVNECLTTSKTLSDMINALTPTKSISFIEPGIPDYFKPSDLPKQPVVAIHCREARKAAKIIKSFYLKYPLFRFISFKDMHSMTEKDFANNLKECAVSVWIDDDSSFGTFPVESIKCNVPVIGKIPTIIPEWITDDNGMWVYDENQIIDIVFNYMKNWMEDSLPENITNISDSLKDKYKMETFEKATLDLYDSLTNKKIIKLNKIKETFEKTLQNNEK